MKNRLLIDPYEELRLPRPVVCGLISKIISPKGKRRLNDQDRYEYSLNSELLYIYDGNPVSLESDGVYWIMDISKSSSGELFWYHYIVVIKDSEVIPVAEFLKCHDSTWIKDAVPKIKECFDGNITPCKFTRFAKIKKSKGWAR